MTFCRFCRFLEILHFGKNLYILPRQDWPRQRKIWSNSLPVCSGKEFFEFFLANNPPARLEQILSCRDLALPQTLPNHRGLEEMHLLVGPLKGHSLNQKREERNYWKRNRPSSHRCSNPGPLDPKCDGIPLEPASKLPQSHLSSLESGDVTLASDELLHPLPLSGEVRIRFGR